MFSLLFSPFFAIEIEWFDRVGFDAVRCKRDAIVYAIAPYVQARRWCCPTLLVPTFPDTALRKGKRKNWQPEPISIAFQFPRAGAETIYFVDGLGKRDSTVHASGFLSGTLICGGVCVCMSGFSSWGKASRVGDAGRPIS